MTIIELMMTSSILLVILLTVFGVLDNASASQAYQADRTKSIDEMRNVLNKMTKELRQATTVTESASTASTITFTSYINGATVPIVYTASGTTLTKTTPGGTATLLKNLATTSIFTYTKADAATGIQWVAINLQVNPARRPDTTLVLDSQINLRNRTTAETSS